MGRRQASAREARKTYTIGVVGEGHKNRDGSSRQAEIRRCSEGDPVTLLRERDNPFDAGAILVVTKRGRGIGYISREHNQWVGEHLDKGKIAWSTIYEVIGGEPGKPSRGVLLSIGIQ